MDVIPAVQHDHQPLHQDTTELTPIQHLEGATERAITISTHLSPSNLAKCHPQLQSPLFALPRELRDMIFEYATAPTYISGCVTKRQQFETSRPGHEAKQITCVDLLSSCRRVWLEANHLPMQQAHHCFYLPAPEWDWVEPVGALEEIDRFSNSLTPNNRSLFRRLHIFAYLRYFRTHARYLPRPLLSSAGACPEVLTLTVRHNSCPGWNGDHESLNLWVNPWLGGMLAFQASSRLREIRLEIERVQERRRDDDGLRGLVAGIRERHACAERVDELGNQVRVELQEEMPEMVWRQYEEPRKEVYEMVTLVWKVVPVIEASEGREETPAVPEFTFSDEEQGPFGATQSGDVAMMRRVEERWAREGSLLRFMD